jgi:Leucine-rich repeat (LRR) protein
MFGFLFHRRTDTFHSAWANPTRVRSLTLFKGTDLKKFAELVPRLTRVHTIEIGWQCWTELPERLSSLPSLRLFRVLNTPILDFPTFLSGCPRLDELVLRGSDITEIPPEIGQFQALRRLDFSNNRLRTIAPELGQLKCLRLLTLADNQLETVPDLSRLKLRSLCLVGNRLKSSEVERIWSWFPKHIVSTGRIVD